VTSKLTLLGQTVFLFEQLVEFAIFLFFFQACQIEKKSIWAENNKKQEKRSLFIDI
jgi:hypothetical protein